MEDLLNFITVYYQCSALAETYELSQPQRFACNETYQIIKRLFLDAELKQVLTHEQNTEGYLLFKSWEAENPALVQSLQSR